MLDGAVDGALVWVVLIRDTLLLGFTEAGAQMTVFEEKWVLEIILGN